MKTKLRIVGWLVLLALSMFNLQLSTAHAQGAAFIYQGRLNSGANPAGGIYDLRFTIYDSASGGSVVSAPLTNSVTSVTNGLFTVTLDFGSGVFTGNARWLDIGVRTNGPGAFTALAPRQALTATPYAIMANIASNLSGTLPAAQVSGPIPASQLSGTAGAATNFTGTLAGDVTGPQSATVVAAVGGQTAANVAGGASAANAATNANAANTIVKRDANGSFTNTSITLSGSLYLPFSTSSKAAIYAGANTPLMIGDGTDNFFAGPLAGNLSVSIWSGDTGLGSRALEFLTSGNDNTGVGSAALASDTSGSENTAVGYAALFNNTNGAGNTAVGANTLYGNVGGSANVAVGDYALNKMIMNSGNVGVGNYALFSSTNGNNNTAVGWTALYGSTNGSYNVALGYMAGRYLVGGSSNIDIGNYGVATDTNIIRIGSQQAQAFIAGVINGNGGGLTNLNAALIGGLGAAGFWQLGGNAGTTPGSSFLGTSDNQPLELRVNNSTALLLQPSAWGASVAAGGGATASGATAVSMGYHTTASGSSAVALGDRTTASGLESTALGEFTTASGDYAMAMGANNKATNGCATATGTNTLAGGVASTAMGRNTKAMGNCSVSMGLWSTASGANSLAGGYDCSAAGTASVALGYYAYADHGYSFVWNDGSSGVSGDIHTTAENQFVIGASGGVGIGAAPGDALLDIQGNVRLNKHDIFFRESTDRNHGVGWYGAGRTFGATSPDGPVLYGWTGGGLGFAGNGTNLALAWNGTGGGNVYLDPLGTNAGTLLPGLTFGANSSEGISSKRTSGTDQYGLDFYTANTIRMNVNNNGNVGIGTTSPDALLTVNGTADKPGGGSWSTFSDVRLKKNIQPLSGVLQKLLALHGVSFEYKEPEKIHELSGERIGMIAQEVERVFPDWVESGPEGYKRLTYRGFEALTVEALRELRDEKDAQLQARDAEMQGLTQKVEQKETEITELKARLERLEQLVTAKNGGGQ